MKPEQLILQLQANRMVFKSLFAGKEAPMTMWKPNQDAWSLLEIACHLYDEEREDFRTRVFNTLFTPEVQPPSIDPPGWITERKYAKQDYTEKVNAFLAERNNSIRKLKALKNTHWEHVYVHPLAGHHTAYQLLANWLAHDYHHIRQINRRLYEYLRESSQVGLGYAGEW
jgi:DinB superfamily